MAILDSTIIKGDLKVLGKIKEYDNSGIIFSTAEQIIGTWVDGKTLYQKTFVQATTSANNDITVGAASNYDMITIDLSNTHLQRGSWSLPAYFSTSTDHLGIWLHKTSDNWVIESRGTDSGNGTLYVTILYTKAN